MGFSFQFGSLLLLWSFGLMTAADSSVSSELLPKVEGILTHTETISNDLKYTDGRVTALEKEVSGLCQTTINGVTCDYLTKVMKDYYKALDQKMDRILKLIEDMHTDYVEEIVAAIRARRFMEAEEKLDRMENPANIPIIVEHVYGQNQSNFGIVVEFAREVSNFNSSYEILTALYALMPHDHHDNPILLIILAEALECKFIKQGSCPEEIKTGARALYDELVATIKTSILSLFVKITKESTFVGNQKVQDIASRLALFRRDLSDEIMQMLVDATFGLVESNRILDNIVSLRNTSQAITGVSALYWSVHKSGHFSSNLMLNLSYSLVQLKHMPEFDELSDARKEAFDTMVATIPTCARNLFFQPLFCLWNEAKRSYAMAASDLFKYDEQRRNIYTLTPAGNRTESEVDLKGAMWAVEKIGDEIFFRNHHYNNEYLYAALVEHGTKARHVFTWIPGTKDAQSAFSIELKRDMCHIKSLALNEYLYASDEKSAANDRYSYILTRKGSLRVNPTLNWQIRAC